jgi:glycyl-tRNA synthetase
LRGETAQGIYVNYKNVVDSFSPKIPFGIAQIGKAFRNEIAPRDFIFRLREMEQMEMQYFIRPEQQKEQYEYWRQFAWDFLTKELLIKEEKLKWHEHADNERAFYAAAAHDIYFEFPQGFRELWGTHNRTDYDLAVHSKHSGKDLSYFDQPNNAKFIPNVIESSVGLDRMFRAVLTDAYREDEQNGEKRIYLALPELIAPVKFAVFPLLKNKPELVAKAREVYEKLKAKHGAVMWDDNGNIGKRYRRQDEIGTPKCVTVDFDSLEDDTVTIRDRDTTEQVRVKIGDFV